MSRSLAWGVMAGSLLAVQPAAAQTCTVSATPLSFGIYNPVAAAADDVSATVTVSCIAVVAISVSYAIQLGGGSGGSVAARSLAGASARLPYQIYTNAARSSVWGDGSGGSTTVADGYSLLALGSAARSYTAYGRIAARQLATAGIYSDVLTVLVTY